jgi:hypothetical protein
MSRRLRACAALFSILAFLFAQAAVSASACAGPVMDPVAMAQMKAAMGDEATACESHCARPSIAFEAAKPLPATMPVVVAAPLRIIALEPAPRHAVTFHPPVSAAGPAPPLIRFTVLRI